MGLGELVLILLPQFLRLGLLPLGAGEFLLHQGSPLLQDAVDPAEQELFQHHIQDQQVQDGKDHGG